MRRSKNHRDTTRLTARERARAWLADNFAPWIAENDDTVKSLTRVLGLHAREALERKARRGSGGARV